MSGYEDHHLSETKPDGDVGALNASACSIARQSICKATVVIIEPRLLSRDCLLYSLKGCLPDQNILPFSTPEEWLDAAIHNAPEPLLLLCIGEKSPQDKEVTHAIDLLSQAPDAPSIMLVCYVEDSDLILGAIKGKVRGCITMSVNLKVAVEAMNLVRAGGIYLPATSLLAKRSNGGSPSHLEPSYSSVFSNREREVLKAVREGKANKVIAYELSMTESTVKVHVRNIMKKLRAKNRTEVAFKTTGMFDSDTGDDEAMHKPGEASFSKYNEKQSIYTWLPDRHDALPK
jgi:DNA-binding NarL/FixJ family response regulator